MEQYISKVAVVAEIEKWINGWTERLKTNPSNPSFFEGGIELGKHILSFLDTIEVKEIDLDREIKRYRMNNPIIGHKERSLYDYMANVAKHFFELGQLSNKK